MNDKNEEINKSNFNNIDQKEKIRNQSLGLNFLKKKSVNSAMTKNKFFEKFSHRTNDITPLLNNRMNPLKNCILALSFSKEERNNNPAILKCIESYLKSLPGFMNIITKEQGKYTLEEKLKQILINLKYEYYPKNTVMFKYGDKGDKFYIILKGKIGFLIPKKIKCNLNEEEYLSNIIKYYQNGEQELVKYILRYNQQIFDFGEDFEKYITDIINDFYKKNKKYKYSMSLYKKLIELSSYNFKRKNDFKNNNIINIQTYIDMNKIIIGNTSSKNKKPVILYNYLYVNNYEDGQTFGYMALENKSNKRTSTAITITDCELAFLDKEEYSELIGGAHHKTRNNLYELISSLKVLGNISKPTFDYDVIHKIKFINFKTNDIIIEENKNLNLFFIFYSGSFKLSVTKNITGLNELICKLKKIRGKILGIPDDIIQKDISEQLLEINGSIVNKKYCNEAIKKEYLKKHNFTISIITDSFLLGLPDTVDPETNLTLFNCICISNYCDGYEITNKALKMICKGERYKFNNDVIQMSLIKINYYINRIIHYKNSLLIKIKEMEFSLNKLSKILVKNKNKCNLKQLNIESKAKSMSFTQNKFLVKKNSINNNEREKINKIIMFKTSTDFRNNKTINIKNSLNLKSISFPKLFKKKLTKSIFSKKYSKRIEINENSKLKNKKKAIEDIFYKKNKAEDIFENESIEYSKSFTIREESINKENKSKLLLHNEKKKINKDKNINLENENLNKKKENKYNKLYESFWDKQKSYKNNLISNSYIFNPIDEKIKNNKMSMFTEYKEMIKKKIGSYNKDDDTNNNYNTFSTLNNIDYFLSKERKIKDDIFLDL